MEFKVFTLNCWGILLFSKNRKERIQAIAEALATKQYDVVCLQEVWLDRDFNLIKDKLCGVLPFSHYFHSGVTGSGMGILSRHPIKETFFHKWSVNGYIHKLHHGDWFGGKGLGLCRLKVNNFYVHVYSAHLHAEYNRASDEYQAHRVLQAYDSAQFILLTSGCADVVVLAGDLNTEPGDVAQRLLLSVPGLKDAFNEASDISADMIATCESPRNSFTPLSSIKKNCLGTRIDYVMYRPGSDIRVDVKKYTFPLPYRVPDTDYSYSDHEAIEVILEIKKEETIKSTTDKSLKKSVLEESIVICNEALTNIVHTKIMYWVLTTLFFVILIAVLVAHSFFNYPVIFYVVIAVLTILTVFTFLMATIWNKMETHAILAGKLAMEVSLEKLNGDCL